ncbi:MAG: RsmE family RNA methyltransferase [bacterium]|nr:RsmE family RNA methyltransferase [bacterium]
MHVPSVILSSCPDPLKEELPFSVELDLAQSHHLLNVLHKKRGDAVNIIFSEFATTGPATISSTKDRVCVLSVKSLQTSVANRKLILLAAYPKNKTADFIVEKAVEIGVTQLIFFFSEHSPRAPGKSEVESRQTRFSRIVESAMKQSGNTIITKVSFSDSLDSAISSLQSESERDNWNSPPPLKLVLTPGAPTNLLAIFTNSSSPDCLDIPETIPLEINRNHADAIIIVGAEGGLSPREQQLALDRNYRGVSLGKNIMRMETAVIAACSIARIAES